MWIMIKGITKLKFMRRMLFMIDGVDISELWDYKLLRNKQKAVFC